MNDDPEIQEALSKMAGMSKEEFKDTMTQLLDLGVTDPAARAQMDGLFKMFPGLIDEVQKLAAEESKIDL